MAQTAVTGFTEPFRDTRPFYRRTYFRVVSRTATGVGDGSASVASGSAQVRLGQLTDFSFPYRFGGRFYLGVRAVVTVTATASGLGTASSSAQVLSRPKSRWAMACPWRTRITSMTSGRRHRPFR